MLDDGFHLLRPDALWLVLLALPAGLLLWRVVRAAGDWTRVIDPELLPYLLEGQTSQRARSGPWLVVAGLLLAVLIIAGPSFEKIDVPVFQRADALVLVLDLSASMHAADVQPSRIRRARQKILDLLDERKEGVTGMVVYAGDAHVVAPLTDDRRTIENLLPALDPGIMPLPGSDAASALETAASLLGAAGVANGQILLITDGMPKFDPDDVRDSLLAANADLSILGIGTAAGAPIPRADGGFIRSSDGEIVVPTLDADDLAAAASALGGRYATVSLDNSDLDALTTVRVVNENAEIQLDRSTDTWLDQGNWLALALALALLPLFRRGALTLLLVIPLLGADPAAAQANLWQTRDQQGAAALAGGEPERAAELFENPAWRGTAHYEAGSWQDSAKAFGSIKDADNYYNLGNALALQGDYQQAIDAYNQSLALKPDQPDALQNRELLQQLLEQQQQQEQQSQDNSDQSSEGEQSDGEQQSSNSESEGGNNPQDPNSTDSQQQDDASQQDNRQGDENASGQQGNESGGEQQANTGDSADDSNAGSQSMGEQLDERLEAKTQEQMSKFDQALEKQQALEQWLRRVPDDPGGLLKRKFRYESIQRLRRGEEPDEDIRW